MLRVLSCVVTEHDLRLVLLAAVICAVAAFTSFRIYSRATDARSVQNRESRRLAWLALTGLSTGAGIWSTHFVAMLAYDPGFPIAYDPALTSASLVIAIGVTTLGYIIAAAGDAASPVRDLEKHAPLDLWLGAYGRDAITAAGGAVVGAGITTMHYTGMAAVSVPGVMEWDGPYVVTSVVLGVALAAAGMVANRRLSRGSAQWVAPTLLTLAICALHFTAMSAATVVPDPTIMVQPSVIHTGAMAVAVAGVTMLVMLAAVAAALVSAQAERDGERELRRQNEILRQRDEELEARGLQLDAALNNMVQGLAVFDAERRVVIANARYGEIYGLTPEEVRPGTTLQQIVERRVAKGRYPGQTAKGMLEVMLAHRSGGRAAQYDVTLDGDRYVNVSVQPMPNGGSVTTHHDITEQRRSEAKIAHMALHDTLTGLPNRTLLNERLGQSIARLKGADIAAAHLLDLDLFKNVNDTLGHSAGDELLKKVAARLGALARSSDTVARMGGDEFAIVQAGIADPSEATRLAQRVIDALSEPYEIDGHEVVIGTSVGIALAPGDGLTADQLMRNADLALYRAKGDGRGTSRFFEPEMNALMQSRRSMERDLRKGLAEGEFELYYQPIADLRQNSISCCEALVRWQHPEKGLISPAAFVSVAEEMGLIVPLGEWVLRQACATAAAWPEPVKVAVNLSPVQFRRPGLVQVVMNALAASGLAANRLELEITETVLLDDSAATLAMLHQLRAFGVRIAMDDFGTGYSSLSYLQRFPFDKIKIDRSFVQHIADDKGALNIVRAVAALASGLGMRTTAEGVESQEQLDAVAAEGCTEMQGYLLSRPRPASEINEMLAIKCQPVRDAVAVIAA